MKHLLLPITILSMIILTATVVNAQPRKQLEAKDRMGNFEIQDLMSRYNQAETLSSNILKLVQEPMPTEFTTAAKRTAWTKQTTWLQTIRSNINKYRTYLAGVLSDSVVTRKEYNQAQAQCRQIANTPTTRGLAGAMLKRQQTAAGWYQALCDNER